jgi:phosphoglycolate phosphatase
MIGDRSTDVAGARVNGIGAIAAGWGYGGEAELRAARPDLTFAKPAELRAFVTALEPR